MRAKGQRQRSAASDPQRARAGGASLELLSIRQNRYKKSFEVELGDQIYDYAFHRCAPEPTAEDPVVDVYVDLEIGGDGFSYRLRSGVEGTALVDQVLDANSDPSYVRDMLLHKLTLEAQKQLASSRMSKREIIRRLETSPTQFYRLMDQSNYRKSVDQMLRLLAVLDCDVEFVVRSRP